MLKKLWIMGLLLLVILVMMLLVTLFLSTKKNLRGGCKGKSKFFVCFVCFGFFFFFVFLCFGWCFLIWIWVLVDEEELTTRRLKGKKFFFWFFSCFFFVFFVLVLVFDCWIMGFCYLLSILMMLFLLTKKN